MRFAPAALSAPRLLPRRDTITRLIPRRRRREPAVRFIPTRAHGFMDYSVGALLIAAPWLLGFRRDSVESLVPIALGAGVLAYSLFTDYELGAVRKIDMPVHLGLDAASGALLAASPWIFGFSDRVRVPHLALGLLELGTAAVSRTIPSDR